MNANFPSAKRPEYGTKLSDRLTTRDARDSIIRRAETRS